MTTEMTTVHKEYKYTDENGKTVTIKRSWTRHNNPKKVSLDNWFATCQQSNRIIDAYNDFNAHNPEVDVTYTTFYKRYIAKFGKRHNQIINNQQQEQEQQEQQHEDDQE